MNLFVHVSMTLNINGVYSFNQNLGIEALFGVDDLGD